MALITKNPSLTLAGASSYFQRSSMDPAGEQSSSGFMPTPDQYRFWWHMYANTIFDDALLWRAYKERYRLYRNTRMPFNPFGRLVNFYAGTVYPGTLTDDGLPLPNGSACAVPIDPNTPPELRLAIAQTWRWSNFQAQKAVLVRYGAALGDAFIEVVERPETDDKLGKVWYQVWWPGFIDDLEVSPQGNVQAFALEYEVTPPSYQNSKGSYRRAAPGERPYIYRKEVDREAVRTYKDDQPFGYDDDQPEWEHGLGFCPGAWVKHRDYGGDHGANAWESSQAKLEELNALASRIHDQVHKVVSSPVIFWTDAKIKSLTRKTAPPGPDADEVRHPDAARDEVMVLKGPSDGRKENLVGDLNISDALLASDRLIAEIEADHPELVMWRELREMSQVTGPGARRMTGDTLPRIGEASANYDRALIACHGMAVAIAGQRLFDGDWSDPTRQQELFDGFDLTSYSRGELDHNIMPRQVIEDTEDERLARAEVKLRLGIDQETIWEDIGLDKDRIAMVRKRKAEQDKAAIERQAAMFSSGQTRGAFGGGPFDSDEDEDEA